MSHATNLSPAIAVSQGARTTSDYLSHVVIATRNGSIPLSLLLLSDLVSQALDVAKHTYRPCRDNFDVDAVVNKLSEITAIWQGEVSVDSLFIEAEKVLVSFGGYDSARVLVSQRAASIVPSDNHVRVVKRDGSIIPWTPAKIENATRRAFLSVHQSPEPSEEIADRVNDRVLSSKRPFINIEEVQDFVQEELMRAGQFKVAAAYIIYRAERAHQRSNAEPKPVVDPTQDIDSLLTVIDYDNTPFLWDGSDLRARISFASVGLDLDLSPADIEAALRASLSDSLPRTGVRNTIIMNARVLIAKNADFAQFAGRILLTYIYEESLGWDILRDGVSSLRDFHVKKFPSYVKRAVELERLSPDVLTYDLEALAEVLDPAADLGFDYGGIQALFDRYLIIDKSDPSHPIRIETPQFLWLRVAMGHFLLDTDREARAIALYQLYKARRFCSSTPTLFNSGTLHSQMSSCYLYWVDDSITSIFQKGICQNADLSKWAGGLGGSWTSVRGTGSRIHGTNGESQGVIPFLKVHNDQLAAVNQGGKRKGSGCVYLEVWHNDIEDFLELRKNTGDDRRRCHDMNTANWIPDLFMKRKSAKENWTLFRSNEVPDLHNLYGKAFEERYLAYEQLAAEGKIFGKTVPAIQLWKKMLMMLVETGHPWITFKDPCNLRSPQDHAGVIHSSNLCTEITLNTSEDETAVCNLGSIILENHLRSDGSLDHERLRETIQIAIRALDNVIDVNFYPTEPARNANLRHRPVGLGVMGLANALSIKGIPFESEAAIEFNDEFMEAIAYYAYEASSDLAAEKGTYSSYEGSKWSRGILPQDTIDILEAERGLAIDVPRGGKLDWTPVREKIAAQGMRNSNVLAIAPTATISIIMASTPCIEPPYKHLYVKDNLGGQTIVMNPLLMRALKEAGLWDEQMLRDLKDLDGYISGIKRIPDEIKRLFPTAFDVNFKYIVECAARRQKWIDQSQSCNFWLAVPDLKEMAQLYALAWSKGLKTTYYLRSMGASAIKKSSSGAHPQTATLTAPAKLDEACESCQ